MGSPVKRIMIITTVQKADLLDAYAELNDLDRSSLFDEILKDYFTRELDDDYQDGLKTLFN